MRRPNPHTERAKLVEQAQRAFIRAAAACTEWPFEKDALAMAILEGALGLHKAAQADPDHVELAKVEKVLRQVRREKGEHDDTTTRPDV